MSPVWEEKIWPIKVMAAGMVSKGFLIVLPESFTLVLHGLLRDFPDIQAKQGGGGGYDLAEILGYYPPLG